VVPQSRAFVSRLKRGCGDGGGRYLRTYKSVSTGKSRSGTRKVLVRERPGTSLHRRRSKTRKRQLGQL